MQRGSVIQHVWDTQYAAMLPPGWQLRTTTALKPGVVGNTHLSSRIIFVAEDWYGKIKREQDAREILAHECAHALLGDAECNAHHGPEWSQTCVRLGGTGHTALRAMIADNPFAQALRVAQDGCTEERNKDASVALHKVIVDELLAGGHDVDQVLEWYMATFAVID